MDSITVSTLSKRYDVSSQTVRSWCDRFGEWLSPNATPPTGEVRTFNNDDLGVLDFVAAMRRSHISYEEIEIALANGERLEASSVGEAKSLVEQDHSVVLAVQYETQLAFRDGQIDQLRKSEDLLRAELVTVREALEVAQERATKAETLLELRNRELENKPEVSDDLVEVSSALRKDYRWWQWWKR